MRDGASLGLEQGRSSGGGEISGWAPIAKSTTSLSNSPLDHFLSSRPSPIHAARPDRILFVVFSHPSSENATWLHSPRSTSCRSLSPGRSVSPLAHLRPPRGNALRPTLRPSLTRPTRHTRLPMRYGLRSGSRSAVEHGVDSDAPASAAVLPTISRPPPMVRPAMNALVLVLTSRSVPGATGRSVQARRRLLVACRRVASSPDSLPGDSLGTPKTGGPEACGEPRLAEGAQVPTTLHQPMKAARPSPFAKPTTSPRRAAIAIVPERARRPFRARHDGEWDESRAPRLSPYGGARRHVNDTNPLPARRVRRGLHHAATTTGRTAARSMIADVRIQSTRPADEGCTSFSSILLPLQCTIFCFPPHTLTRA
jgi:hypothetical protein